MLSIVIVIAAAFVDVVDVVVVNRFVKLYSVVVNRFVKLYSVVVVEYNSFISGLLCDGLEVK